MRNHNVELTTKQAAQFLKMLCTNSEGGKDIIEHIIDMVGGHDSSLLSKVFKSLDPSWDPCHGFKVGDNITLEQYGHFYEGTVVKIDITDKEPLKIACFEIKDGERQTRSTTKSFRSDTIQERLENGSLIKITPEIQE